MYNGKYGSFAKKEEERKNPIRFRATLAKNILDISAIFSVFFGR